MGYIRSTLLVNGKIIYKVGPYKYGEVYNSICRGLNNPSYPFIRPFIGSP